MTLLILAALAALAVWTISLYALPFRTCTRCKGAGRHPKGLLNKKGPCSRCRSTGRVQRIGSGLVHQTVLLLRAEYGRPRKSR